MEATLKQTPSYRALLCRKFSQWLKTKYGTQEVLEVAWGKGALPEEENLSKENIYPQPNHGLFTQESEKAWKAKTSLPKHIADKVLFLYEEQAKFYTRFEKAIRSTGYKGLIVGSCWQAGSGIAHLLNLYADYGAGVIDRHNYFGGGTGHTLQAGKVDNNAMVNQPGSGLLSTGFQQVSNRPFFISEWMSLIPTEWIAESAPLIAAYGLGLQGWDASFAFAMDYPHFTPTIQSGHGVHNATSPTHLALYPALAAMVYRNDVRKAPVIANRDVYIDDLNKGNLPFFEKVEQQSDIKKIASLFPLETLAKGRVALTFHDQKENAGSDKTELPAMPDKIIKSTTGQLEWDYRDKGYFTINTSGTQGVVGFLPGSSLTFSDISINSPNKFAVILATSLDKKKQLADVKHILITTIARARNTNMKYNEDKTALLDVGQPPLLLEPVQAEIIFRIPAKTKVYVLDHSGNRTSQQVLVRDGKILLDGIRDKAIYYEIVRE